MAKTLTDRVIVITGASSGIGAAVGRLAARAGMDVVLTARREEKLESVAREVESAGRSALVVVTDVARPEQLDALVEQTMERFGRLDVMMANAGYGHEIPFAAETAEEHARMFEVNYFGTLHAVRAALPVMKKAKGGQIIITSSILGRLGMPEYGAYCASKAAQQVFAQSLRAELAGDQIDVTTVYPIGTRSEFFEVSKQRSGSGHLAEHTPAWMMQSPERVARAILRAMHHPRPEVWPAWWAHWASGLAVLFPRLTAYSMRRTYEKAMKKQSLS